MDEGVPAARRTRDEASKLLGEKMLQGWTMLGISCPVEDCYTPLVRSRQGKTFCVRCGQYILTEEEAKQQREELEAQQSAAAAEAEAEAEAAALAEEEERKHRIEQQFRLQEQAKKAQEMQELEQLAAARRATATVNGSVKRKAESVVEPSDATDDEVKALRRQTLAALYQKMGALTDSLTPNDHSERLVAVTKALREMAEVAQLLKQ